MAVGMELTLVGLVAYVPVNLLYQLMAGTVSHFTYVCRALKLRVLRLALRPKNAPVRFDVYSSG
jgi:hypothetical protein